MQILHNGAPGQMSQVNSVIGAKRTLGQHINPVNEKRTYQTASYELMSLFK